MTSRKQKNTRASSRNMPERDDQGRFVSDDETSHSNGRNTRQMQTGSHDYDDNDMQGWYGDPDGHAQAARKGWAQRRDEGYGDDDRYYSRQSRGGGRYNDDYRYGRRY